MRVKELIIIIFYIIVVARKSAKIIITLISVLMNFLKKFSSQKQKDGLYPPHDEGSFVFFSAFFSFSSSCESSRTKENSFCEHHPP
jgi:hypothetical protein